MRLSLVLDSRESRDPGGFKDWGIIQNKMTWLSEKKEDKDSHGKNGRPGRVGDHAGMFCSAFEKHEADGG